MSTSVTNFPKLYGTSSTGAIKEWEVIVIDLHEYCIIKTFFGQQNGKKQIAERIIDKGKNIGKINETSIYEQAISEANTLWNKQLDKNYTETLPNDLTTEHKILPMLAQDYHKRGKDIKWPAYIQPKLDGIRCLAHKISDDEVVFISRKGKVFDALEHLKEHLIKGMLVDEIFDGELFTQELNFQQICSAVKTEKKKNPLTEKVQYWIYDVADPTKTFEERNERIEDFFISCNTDVLSLVEVPTILIENEEKLKLFHARFIQEGYEGSIIRNSNGYYKFDYRSTDLQKYKDFETDEYEIIAVTDGTGKETGAAIFKCITKEGKEFEVRPRGTYELRRKWFNEADKLINKQLTVRYQELTNDLIPRFPVGCGIRDYE